jgi:hypothetical protein
LEKPLQRRMSAHRFCKFGRSAQNASRTKPSPASTRKWSRLVRHLPFRSILRPFFGRDGVNFDMKLSIFG